jgi:hypothetical protein
MVRRVQSHLPVEAQGSNVLVPGVLGYHGAHLDEQEAIIARKVEQILLAMCSISYALGSQPMDEGPSWANRGRSAHSTGGLA